MPGLAHNVARDEFWRVLEHMDEAVHLAQHVIRNMPRGARLAVQEDRDVGVAKADLLDEGAQVGDGLGRSLGRGKLLIIDRQDEGRATALLLHERGQIAIARDPEHLDTLRFDRLGERTNPQPRSVLRAKVFVDDDDGEVEFHPVRLQPIPAGQRNRQSTPVHTDHNLPKVVQKAQRAVSRPREYVITALWIRSSAA